MAWKIDSHLAIVLQSNVALFADLIRRSFMQNNLFINNYLPIIRVESELRIELSFPLHKYKNSILALLTDVSVHGTPQHIMELETLAASPNYIQNGLIVGSLTENQCRHHIDKLKILNLVANLKVDPSPDDYEKEMYH